MVLPVLDGVPVDGALQIASMLAGPDGDLILLAIVPVLRGQQLPAAAATARTARAQLRTLARSLPRRASVEVLVRAAGSIEAGIRQVAAEGDGILVVPLPRTMAVEALALPPYRGLLAAPVLDTLLVRAGVATGRRNILVAARGGPNAELATAIGRRLAGTDSGEITLLHIDVPRPDERRRQREQHLFRTLIPPADDRASVRAASVSGGSPVELVLTEAERHGTAIFGAFAGPIERPGFVGELPARALANESLDVVIAKTRLPVHPALFRPVPVPIDSLVDDWFVEHTLHCRDYAAVADLAGEKRLRGITVGVALIACTSHDTFGAFGRVLLEELTSGMQLIDKAVVLCPPDSEIEAAAAEAGFVVQTVAGATADQYGRLLHAAVRAVDTDIVVCLDADVRNAHAKLVYGLAGPLIENADLVYVKGFHRLPADADEADLLDLVGEFSARPLLNLFFSDLAGIIDPLGTEHAVRRAEALLLPIFSGGAAAAGLLIDVADRFGLDSVAQVGLEERIARRPDLEEARRKAFSATQIIAMRLGLAGEPAIDERRTPSIKVVFEGGERLQIAEFDAGETELPPEGAPGGPAAE